LQMQSGFLQLESTLHCSVVAYEICAIYLNLYHFSFTLRHR
jgi:hypothetical protein